MPSARDNANTIWSEASRWSPYFLIWPIGKVLLSTRGDAHKPNGSLSFTAGWRGEAVGALSRVLLVFGLHTSTVCGATSLLRLAGVPSWPLTRTMSSPAAQLTRYVPRFPPGPGTAASPGFTFCVASPLDWPRPRREPSHHELRGWAPPTGLSVPEKLTRRGTSPASSAPPPPLFG